MNKFLSKLIRNRFFVKHREKIVMIIDMIMIGFSYCFALLIRYDFDMASALNKFGYKRAFILCVGSMGIHLIVEWLSKTPYSLWSYVSIDEIIAISIQIVCSTIVMIVGAAFVTSKGTSAYSVICIAEIVSFFMLLSVRFIYRFARTHFYDTSKFRNALIIGAGEGGYIMLRELQRNRNHQVNVIGFIDDIKAGNTVAGKKVLGTTHDLPKICENYGIMVAYIAIPSISKFDLNRIVKLCQDSGIDIKIMHGGDDLAVDPEKFAQNAIKDINIEDLLGRGEVKLNLDEIGGYINNQVVMVSGAGGSIGSEICRQVVKFNPKQLLMVDIYENTLYYLEQEFLSDKAHGKLDPNLNFISLIASIRDKKEIGRLMDVYKPDVIFHAAAHKHVPLMETQPQEAIKNNVFGTYNLITEAIEHKVKNFIMISTDKAVNPTNVMGASKRLTEMILQAYGNNTVTQMAAVRFGNVLGSNGSVIPIFKKQIEQGGPVTLTHRDIKRYFMTIPEAARLVLQAGAYAKNGDIFVLDMGEPVKIIDLAENMIRLAGYKPYKDIDIVEIGLRPGEKMFEELRLSSENTTKTSNDMIYVNKHMDISIAEINEKLQTLEKLVNQDEIDGDYLKEEIFKLIK